MSLDIIKSYLIGIGFKIDQSTLNNTQQKMNDAEKTVKTFAKNNSSSVASMQQSTSDIGMLMGASIGAIAKIFPGMEGPLNKAMKHINLVKGVFNAFSKSVKKDMGDAKSSVNDFQSGTSKKTNSDGKNTKKSTSNKPKNNGNTSKTFENNINDTTVPFDSSKIKDKAENTAKGLTNTTNEMNALATTSGEAGKALETFEAVGSTAIEGFSLASLGPIALIAAAIAAVSIAAVALTKFLGSLASEDIGYQKLARQLWTTKQNAKEIDMALKTMGVTMQDLWLSPQLLAQFNQLRKDSEELKLPDSFNRNIKVVQELGFEFQRLKQAGSLALQWLGSYILQYIAGPLDNIKGGLHNFNDTFLKEIPKIMKGVAIPIGMIVRLLLDLVQAIGFIWNIVMKVFNFIGSALDKIPKPIQNIIKIIGLLALVLLSPIAAIIAVILVFDDLMTAMRGGKSVTGDWVKDMKAKVDKAAAPFVALWKTIQKFYANIKKGEGDIAAPFVAFGEKVQSVLEHIKKIIDDIKKKAIEIVKPIADAVDAVKGTPTKVVKAVKSAPSSIASAVENAPANIWSSLKSLVGQSNVNYSIPSAASTKNTNTTSSSVANSNNKSSNTNTFNVYGTNPTSTAATIGKTLTGIQIRNLGGVY
ncbi:hypothetical protein KTC96_24720 (plasmid) [Clostridium estertheticum]|uniref:hypothetical protein n=1 Tax=Clostridium estertheticum TaxID=238834 RepID=UPI001C7CA9F1|nr:hypothetical protein [Clostridium estertheticum]MBX4259732.1 hypothetical protein [Clostridium estertheticum]WLC73319.1 hypothetical protein KTC96_24720 [Clostridium estertheticum]